MEILSEYQRLTLTLRLNEMAILYTVFSKPAVITRYKHIYIYIERAISSESLHALKKIIHNLSYTGSTFHRHVSKTTIGSLKRNLRKLSRKRCTIIIGQTYIKYFTPSQYVAAYYKQSTTNCCRIRCLTTQFQQLTKRHEHLIFPFVFVCCRNYCNSYYVVNRWRLSILITALLSWHTCKLACTFQSNFKY